MQITPDLSMASRFLQSFNEDLVLTFQVFDDSTPKRQGLAYHLTESFESASLIEKLIRSNSNRCGVYFMLNRGDGKGRSNENITAILGLCADLDGAPLQPVLECGLEPHFINESSPGKYQVFWLLDPIDVYSLDPNREKSFEIARDKFAAWQKALAVKFNADRSVVDLARVFRVPGFFHNKNTPFKTHILETGPLETYSINTVIKILGLEQLVEKAEQDLRKPLLPVNDLLKNKLGPSERHETLTRFAYKYIHQGLDPTEALMLLKALNQTICNPPIDRPGELEKLISSAYNKYQKQQQEPSPSKTIEPQKVEAMFASQWLDEPFAVVTPILEGLYDKGDKIAIIGQSKTRKSFFAMQMAIQLACGLKFLGYSPPGPLKVLIVQYEIKKSRYHARCKTMIKQLSLTPEQLSNLIIVNARGVNCDPMEILKKQVEIHRPDIVIVDPLYKLIKGDESKIEEIKPILREFDILAETTGASVAYVHHDKKGLSGEQQLTDRGAGSGVISRDIDTGIYLSPHKDQDDTLVIEFVSRNHAPQQPQAVEWRDYHFGSSNASLEKQNSRNQANKKPKLKQQMESVYALIRDITAYGETEIGAGVFNIRLKDIGISKDNWPGIKEQLVKEGRIEIVKSQSKKKGESNLTIKFLAVPEQIIAEETSTYSDYGDEPF